MRLRAPILSLAILLVSLAASGNDARADRLPPALAGWLNAEQATSRLVDEQRIVALDNHQAKRYSPEGGKVFRLKTYWLNVDATHVFKGQGLSADLRRQLVRTKNGQQQVRLIVHPESEDFYRNLTNGAQRGEDLMASATASSRTLMAWSKGQPENAFFAKVSLDREIGGVVRTLPKGEIARSIGINDTLAAAKGDLPRSFRYLPEVFGVMPKGMERGGMLIRSIPKQYRSGKTRLVPLFSLYSAKGRSAPELVRMVRESGMEPVDFVREKFVKPFAKEFMDLAIRQGITMEPHAQNVLVEIGSDGQPTGKFVHRDFGGFNVDFRYRKANKMTMAKTLPTVTSLTADYHTAHHGDSLDAALYNYFSGGFLYAVEKTLGDWHSKGRLRGAALRKGTLEGQLVSEVKTAYKEITGKDAKWSGTLYSIEKMVKTGRTLHQKRVRAVSKQPILTAKHRATATHARRKARAVPSPRPRAKAPATRARTR